MTFKEQSEILNRQRIKEWTHLCESAGIYLKSQMTNTRQFMNFLKNYQLNSKAKNKKG